MNVYGQLIKAALENSASDLSSVTGLVYFNTSTLSPKFYNGTAWKTLVDTSTAQVITAKDIDGGTASNTSRITMPKAATATLNALTRKAGTVVFDTSTGTFKGDDGAVLTEFAASGSTILTPTTGADANTVLTEADGRLQQVTPTTARTYKLNPAAFSAGDFFEIVNMVAGGEVSDKRIFVTAADNTVISQVYANGSVRYYARVNNPATNSDWREVRQDDENWYVYTPTSEMGGVDVSAKVTYDKARWRRKQNTVHLQVYAHWNANNTDVGDFRMGLPIPAAWGAAAGGFNDRMGVHGYYTNSVGSYPVLINLAGGGTQGKTVFQSLRRNIDPTYYGVGDGNLNSGPWGTSGDVINVDFFYESSLA